MKSFLLFISSFLSFQTIFSFPFPSPDLLALSSKLQSDQEYQQYANSVLGSNSTEIYFNYTRYVRYILNSTLTKSKEFISDECYTKMKKIFVDVNGDWNYANYFTVKFIVDSSKSKNEIISYEKCIYKLSSYSESYVKPVYLLAAIDVTHETRKETNETYSNTSRTDYLTYQYLMGWCLPNVCSKKDYRYLLINDNIFFNNFLSWDSMVDSEEFLQVEPIDENYGQFTYTINEWLNMIPFVIFIVLITETSFGFPPLILFKYCFRNKNYKKGSVKEIEQGKYNQRAFKLFKSCLTFKENFEDLWNYSMTSSKITNESGMIYIKGLRGINMVLLIFGFTFFIFLNSPVCMFGEWSFQDILGSIWFFLYYIGLRYSPRILFSCSGFSWTYKLLCYLDDQLEEAKNQAYQSSSSPNETNNESINLESKNHSHLISYKILWKWFCKQLPKYWYYILWVSFMRYTLYKLIIILQGIGPMWTYFNLKVLEKTSFYHVFLAFINCWFIFGVNNNLDYRSILNCFWMVSNEIIYFFPISVIIFIGYKYSLRIDLAFIVLLGMAFVLKILGYWIGETEFIASVYFYNLYYGKYMNGPLNNSSFYLIGVLFGSCNYVVQTGLLFETANKAKKQYLFLSIRFTNFFKGWSKYAIIAFSVLIIIWLIILSIMQPLFLVIYKFMLRTKQSEKKDDHYYRFFHNVFYNWILVLDIEIVVFWVNFLCFAFYVKGNNFLNDFFCASFWSLFNKTYYSFILIINPILWYIFYQSETRIHLNWYNLFLYSCIGAFIVLVTSWISYIWIELPYKRVAKFCINIGNEIKKDEEEEKDEIENRKKSEKDEDTGRISEISEYDEDLY